MRGCLTLAILLILAAASGYTIWQVRLLREDVDQLQAHLRYDQRASRQSMIAHARAAIEALEEGDLDRAQEELDQLSGLVERARTMAAQQRNRLRDRLDAARDAIAQGGARANELLEDLWRELSSARDQERPNGRPEPPAEQ